MRVLLLCAVALASLRAEALPRRIVAVEWLPLGLHGDVLDALGAAADVKIERESALGDAAELDTLVAKVNSSPPAFVVGFGNRVCEELAVKCPGVPLLAVVGGPAAWCVKAESPRTAPALVFVTEPEAGQVLAVAGRLLSTLDTMAILYTEGYGANDALADALERDPARGERKVVRLTVPPGNCRTDSDFEKALDDLPKEHGVTLLYVPDDPNCSRFGDVICRLAAERNLVTLGSEAIEGKGCAAALVLNIGAVAKEGAAWMRRCYGAPSTVEVRHAPYLVVLDEAVLAAQGLTVKPWDEEVASPRSQ
ncbi:MAG: hypothetical protein RBU21_08925 [FCB group bacterium]|jgi:ABC-type uncharacterized transport system substrate-binding protein|nr:hypothetical protein [FCB group bacterium]